jgi:hypothetical protein
MSSKTNRHSTRAAMGEASGANARMLRSRGIDAGSTLAMLLVLAVGESPASAACVQVERGASPGSIVSESSRGAKIERAAADGQSTKGLEVSVNIPMERSAGERKPDMIAVERSTQGRSGPAIALERASTAPLDGEASGVRSPVSNQSECSNKPDR